MTERDPYVLGYREAEQDRLERQADELAHESRRLFDEIGLPAGAHVVEIGCGPMGCLQLLAERVGPDGRVVGVERSQEAVDRARRGLAAEGHGNVEVRCADARATGLPRASFDLATARLVLVNFPDPRQIVAEAVALVRPGGCVAFHEADWVAHVCDPPCDAWTTIVALFVRYSEQNGIDPFVGRRLPRLLRDAGLDDVRVHPLVHAYPPGSGRRSILLDFAENLGTRFVAQGLVDEHALRELKAALRRHLDDPATLVVSHLFVQAWGRKPA